MQSAECVKRTMHSNLAKKQPGQYHKLTNCSTICMEPLEQVLEQRAVSRAARHVGVGDDLLEGHVRVLQRALHRRLRPAQEVAEAGVACARGRRP